MTVNNRPDAIIRLPDGSHAFYSGQIVSFIFQFGTTVEQIHEALIERAAVRIRSDLRVIDHTDCLESLLAVLDREDQVDLEAIAELNRRGVAC